MTQEEEKATNPSKVTTTQTVPVQTDAPEYYRRRAGEIDTSDESVRNSPGILEMTELGKRTSEGYREQMERNSRAGKFAAWSQFANALASFIGGAANGQAMPVQQDYRAPINAFGKADAYRDAMAQNDEKYRAMEINAVQNERNRRIAERKAYEEMALKAQEDAYKYGTKVQSVYSPLDDEYKLAAIRRMKSMAGYYDRKKAGGGKVDKVQELPVVDQFAKSIDIPEWLRGRRLYGNMYPEFKAIVEKIKSDAEKKPVSTRNEIERYLTSSDGNGEKFDETILRLEINPSSITQKDKDFYHKLIKMAPEYFREVIEDDSYGVRRTTLSGAYGADADGGYDENMEGKFLEM